MIRLCGCVHCHEVYYLESDLLKQIDFCHSCDSKNVNRWLCLYSKCSYIGCGNKSKDHSTKHFQLTQHPIVINIYNHKIYCYTCQKQVQLLSVDKTNYTTANGCLKSNMDNPYNNQDDSIDSERSLGLVGLKNLGNTCYMNAALQCLLNIPQLTEYFESIHPSFYEHKSHTLTRHYQNLVNDILDYKRKTYVIPTGVCHTIKSMYPPFRGYMQQDAQEFLRVFMDKMHNETKVSCKYDPIKIKSIENGDKLNEKKENSSIDTNDKEYRSIISDVFQGKLSNSIKCLQCERISCNEDYFEDLSLPIATNNKQISTNKWWIWSKSSAKTNKPHDKKQSHSLPPTSNTAISLLYYQLSWILTFLIWIKNWFINRVVTLEQCLELFFSQDELKGDNKYSCDKCQGHQNAVMQSKLLKSPEILCFHLKRFRHDFGCSKITTAVRFPVEGLDMSPFLHPDNKNEIHIYDLISIICHYGSGGGGHYIAYVLNWRMQTWFEFDDDQVTEVDINVILGLTSSAYVLFYKKRDDHMISIREHADKLLKTTFDESVFKYYLSRSWVVRFNTFAEPGPISNNEFLCSHCVVQPEKINIIQELTIEISQKTWAYLINKFGGGPTCTSLTVCAICEEQRNILKQRRELENSTFLRLHRIFDKTSPKKDVHVLSLRWFRKWEDFVKEVVDDLPGPIDNSDVLRFNKTTSTYSVEANSDYGWISMDTWLFFHDIYGGGPAHNICPSPKLPISGSKSANDDSSPSGDNNIEIVCTNDDVQIAPIECNGPSSDGDKIAV